MSGNVEGISPRDNSLHAARRSGYTRELDELEMDEHCTLSGKDKNCIPYFAEKHRLPSTRLKNISIGLFPGQAKCDPDGSGASQEHRQTWLDTSPYRSQLSSQPLPSSATVAYSFLGSKCDAAAGHQIHSDTQGLRACLPSSSSTSGQIAKLFNKGVPGTATQLSPKSNEQNVPTTGCTAHQCTTPCSHAPVSMQARIGEGGAEERRMAQTLSHFNVNTRSTECDRHKILALNGTGLGTAKQDATPTTHQQRARHQSRNVEAASTQEEGSPALQSRISGAHFQTCAASVYTSLPSLLPNQHSDAQTHNITNHTQTARSKLEDQFSQCDISSHCLSHGCDIQQASNRTKPSHSQSGNGSITGRPCCDAEQVSEIHRTADVYSTIHPSVTNTTKDSQSPGSTAAAVTLSSVPVVPTTSSTMQSCGLSDPQSAAARRSHIPKLPLHKIPAPSVTVAPSTFSQTVRTSPKRASGVPMPNSGGRHQATDKSTAAPARSYSNRPASKVGESSQGATNSSSAQTSSPLNNSTPSSRDHSSTNTAAQLPLTPGKVLKQHIGQLTDYEQGEILDFPQVWYWGAGAQKVRGSALSNHNHGFDDVRGDYNMVLHDHLAYRYEVLSLLGRGSFGQVVKAYDYKTNESVAIKIIRNKQRFQHQACVEVKLLEHLYELMKSSNFKALSRRLIRNFAIQLLHALRFLKKQQIIHCDLKPENILLKQPTKSAIKVIDFGSSCFASETLYPYIQSRFYRSPEILLGMKYDVAIDMWSFGCILAELYTGYPLFPGDNENEQLARIMELCGLPPAHLLENASRRKTFFDDNGNPSFVVNNSQGKRRRTGSKDLATALRTSDPAFIDFIAGCLRWDPRTRLTPDEGLQHLWILDSQNYSQRAPHIPYMSPPPPNADACLPGSSGSIKRSKDKTNSTQITGHSLTMGGHYNAAGASQNMWSTAVHWGAAHSSVTSAGHPLMNHYLSSHAQPNPNGHQFLPPIE
eukprot:GHVQ01004555.1.p2 GENE.GHVQ01004555.1~~GHVQ01004555.1.p2  ORF type:complete len:982 (-),score=111.29 GHVQ01004555.1:268-3213(-)